MDDRKWIAIMVSSMLLVGAAAVLVSHGPSCSAR
ncbi:type II secretory pathway component PulJ [Bradyrhizobium sp. LA8.1]